MQKLTPALAGVFIMEKILVSSCLLGQLVRYDGKSNLLSHPALIKWHKQGRLVAFCPEVAAGLPTPREPAEISRQRVITRSGQDVTEPFTNGAQLALAKCQMFSITYALLKENSPSCGSNFIYDGSHSGIKMAGQGLTAALLRKYGIAVFSETQIVQLAALIKD